MSWTDKATTALKITAIKADITALENSIAGNATDDILNYTINGRAVARYTLEEKMNLHRFLNRKLRGFERLELIEAGDGDPGKHKPRF